MFKGLIMYKIEIDISAWGGDEKVTIETSDFDKIELIREFIEFQQENGWAADYEQVAEDDEEEEFDEEDEDEAVTVSTYVITKIED
jgi:phage FluMu gp28-like protein